MFNLTVTKKKKKIEIWEHKANNTLSGILNEIENTEAIAIGLEIWRTSVRFPLDNTTIDCHPVISTSRFAHFIL